MAASAEEEEKKASALALGIATTLLGTVTFVITLMYAINHYDVDMRKHTYSTIVSTISIFCAVLIFSTCNDMLGELGNQLEFNAHQMCMVNMAHMLTWYVLMQLFLAWVCGVIGSFMGNAKTEYEKENSFELNVKCWAQLLAHLTGFASINAWGSLQQLSFFRKTPAMTLLILPAGMLGSFILQRITDTARERLAAWDGEKDKSEETWDEEAEECEDDVMGLQLSFNAVQSIRYFVANTLPNAEGEWEVPDILEEGGVWYMGEIFFAGFIGALGVVVVIALGLLVEEEEEGSEPESDGGEGAEHGEHGEEEEEKPFMQQLRERFCKILVVAFSMVYAWCSFYSGQLLVARLMSSTLGFDEMSVSLALAFFLSAMSFGAIRILDYITDTCFAEGGKGYQATTHVILAIGILVGFAWEQCFDQAVASIASRTTSVWGRHLVKALLALMCVGVLVPAYKRFLLPMQLLQGYKYGFVVQRMGERGPNELVDVADRVTHTLHKRLDKLREQDAGQHGEKLEKVSKLILKLQNTVNKHTKKASNTAAEGGHSNGADVPLLAPQAEEVETSRREADELGSLRRENMRLSKENETFKVTFRESIKVLKTLQQNEEERAEGLRVHNQQMDTVLGRVRGLESRLCLNSQYNYRSPGS
jgi:hypothetical protein